MLAKVSEALVNHKSQIIYSLLGLTIFSTYLFYGRNELAKFYGIELKQKKNHLDTTFDELFRNNKQPNIMKIVLTEISGGLGSYRKIVIERMKKVFPEMNLDILINCSPKKLFQSGCESFIENFEYDDDQYIDYIINLLKEELLIEDTIQKIQNVTQMQNPESRLSIMLCDNNCLDIFRIKTLRDFDLNERIYKTALKKLKIKMADLYDLYPLVIHFQDEAELMDDRWNIQNKMIEKIWTSTSFQGFYQKFAYNYDKTKEQNIEIVINFLKSKIEDYKNELIKNREQANKK